MKLPFMEPIFSRMAFALRVAPAVSRANQFVDDRLGGIIRE